MFCSEKLAYRANKIYFEDSLSLSQLSNLADRRAQLWNKFTYKIGTLSRDDDDDADGSGT